MLDIVNAPNVTIETPAGLTSITNPLLSYKFKQFPLNSTLFPTEDGTSQYPETVRNPNFGNSFESSHGFMHIVVGGSGGHIAPVAYVGFDPILYALLNRQP